MINGDLISTICPKRTAGEHPSLDAEGLPRRQGNRRQAHRAQSTAEGRVAPDTLGSDLQPVAMLPLAVGRQHRQSQPDRALHLKDRLSNCALGKSQAVHPQRFYRLSGRL
jgi:hypothetical protein